MSNQKVAKVTPDTGEGESIDWSTVELARFSLRFLTPLAEKTYREDLWSRTFFRFNMVCVAAAGLTTAHLLIQLMIRTDSIRPWAPFSNLFCFVYSLFAAVVCVLSRIKSSSSPSGFAYPWARKNIGLVRRLMQRIILAGAAIIQLMAVANAFWGCAQPDNVMLEQCILINNRVPPVDLVRRGTLCLLYMVAENILVQVIYVLIIPLVLHHIK